MRRLISLLLAFAWVVPAWAADLPFKVLSTGHVKGQAQAGQSEARDAKALAETWSKLDLKRPVPKVNFKHRMVVSWVGGGSACDKYVLTHVRQEDDHVALEINRVRPPAGRMCIMIFSPSVIVASIPRVSLPIQANVSGGGSTAGETTR
jgi:hypothetical protein